MEIKIEEVFLYKPNRVRYIFKAYDDFIPGACPLYRVSAIFSSRKKCSDNAAAYKLTEDKRYLKEVI